MLQAYPLIQMYVHFPNEHLLASSKHGLQVDAQLDIGSHVQEVDAEAGQGRVAVRDLERFPYVAACLHEALRLYPPGHITVRSLHVCSSMLGIFSKVTPACAICACPRTPTLY